MIPNPLHPAVVHFPVVLAVLLPLAALIALIVVARGANGTRTWLVPAALAVGLAIASFVAVRTGEAQEERVEEVVAERPLHGHEEAAERFLLLSGIVAGIALLGLARGNVGTAARWVATAGALAVLVAGYQVGRSGGELVYQHGAASVYVDGATASEEIAANTVEGAGDEDDADSDD